MQHRACLVDSFSLVRFRLLAPPDGIRRPAQQRGGSGEAIGRHLFARALVDAAMTRHPTVSFYRFVPDMANVHL